MIRVVGWMIVLMGGLVSSGIVQAKHLGVAGAVFPIEEIDMLDWIEQRLRTFQANGELESMQQRFHERVQQTVRRPEPVTGLTTTSHPHTYNVDPSVILQQDIIGVDGRVLYAKGTRINPFDASTWPALFAKQMLVRDFNTVLAFFNADDPQQLAWAQALQREETQPLRFVLTSGEPQAAVEQLKARVYFDQRGHLTDALQISHIPATVRRNGDQWQVDVAAMQPAPAALSSTTHQ
jgi:conjugal transfer pilus assembly protein TraW